MTTRKKKTRQGRKREANRRGNKEIEHEKESEWINLKKKIQESIRRS